MKNAQIYYKENIAYSKKFDDIYFNTDKPWNESEYVFISAIDEIWDTQDSFIVAECGFGAGLNFLGLYNKFKKSDKKLHFVSVEGYPIRTDDLVEIYAKLGVYKSLSKKLIKYYPPLVSGIHRIELEPNITLDLCFGEINSMLCELDFKADVWFMDGFAPSKNEDMWSDEVFSNVARLTRMNGVVRTYSCAKVVRERFPRYGFELELKKGYGKKRQMSHAVLKSENFSNKNIWFARENFNKNLKDILIIGGGVAGCVSAYELKRLGFNVKIAEKRDKIAQNGSGNHCGILAPLITKPDVKLGMMHQNAFLQAVKFYKSVMNENDIKFSGCLEYAYDELLRNRYASHVGLSDEIFSYDDSTKPYAVAFIKDAAYARPQKMCKKASRNVEILYKHEYVSHTHLKNGKISVKFKGKKPIKTDVLIFATGSESVEIFKHLPISSVRGQVTHIKPLLDIKTPMSAVGYVSPAVQGIQVVGASYARNEIDDKIREADDIENLNKVSEFLDPKKAKILGAKVGYRSYSSDRFPIISALHDEEFYKQNYKNLFWIKHKGTNIKPKYEPNVFLNIAHGSRGLCTAVLGARLISDMLLNRPLCIEKSLFNELHSARFLIRKLKKMS